MRSLAILLLAGLAGAPAIANAAQAFEICRCDVWRKQFSGKRQWGGQDRGIGFYGSLR